MDGVVLKQVEAEKNIQKVKYIIISPVRDEEMYIEKTINSVISQTIVPEQWIIVNDGSKDKTGEIIESYASKYTWILPVHRQDRGFRKAGSGVMEAFYDGYKKISSDFDFIIKLDGDLSFEKDYFEKCFAQFSEKPNLGVAGRVIYSERNGAFDLEQQASFNVRGATKIYKKECWFAIGGLLMEPGWDTLDEVKANMLGWKTESFSSIHLYQHRFTGAAEGSIKDLIKNGKANYISGYHPLFMILKCIKRLTSRPYVIGSLSLLYGYLGAYLRKVKQVEDKELIKYLRKQQINKILLKSESIWS